MKNTYIFLFVVIFTSNLYCQDFINKEQKSFVTFSLFTPVLNQAHRWDLGYMHKFNNRFWVGTSIGYGIKKISVVSAEFRRSSDQNYRLFEIRPEIYFDLNVKNDLQQFLSFELFYINHSDRFENSIYRESSNKLEFTYDSANYNRVKTGFNINYNFIIPIYNRIVLMQKVGLGYKHRNVTYSNIKNLKENTMPIDSHDAVFETIRRNGNSSSLHFNLDLQLVYKF